MRIFFAGVTGINSAIGKHLKHSNVKNYLVSFHMLDQMKYLLQIAEEIPNINVIIDSGAFSAWNSGANINLDKYIDFCLKFKDHHEAKFESLYFVNLDVIPGERGMDPNQEQIQRAADEGLKNYLTMKHSGIENLIHVYHQGESLDVLNRMFDYGIDYIGVSPCNSSSKNSKDDWLEYVYKYIPNHIKTHGFAVTSADLIKNYPWYSVDSATYRIASGMGCFIYLHDEKTLKTRVYKHSERTSDIPKNEIERQALEEILTKIDEKMTLNNLKDSKTYIRALSYMKCFKRLEQLINERGHNNKHLLQPILF